MDLVTTSRNLYRRVADNPNITLFLVIVIFVGAAVGMTYGLGGFERNKDPQDKPAEAGQIHFGDVKDGKWREIIAAETSGRAGLIPSAQRNVPRRRGRVRNEFISESPL